MNHFPNQLHNEIDRNPYATPLTPPDHSDALRPEEVVCLYVVAFGFVAAVAFLLAAAWPAFVVAGLLAWYLERRWKVDLRSLVRGYHVRIRGDRDFLTRVVAVVSPCLLLRSERNGFMDKRVWWLGLGLVGLLIVACIVPAGVDVWKELRRTSRFEDMPAEQRSEIYVRLIRLEDMQERTRQTIVNIDGELIRINEKLSRRPGAKPIGDAGPTN